MNTYYFFYSAKQLAIKLKNVSEKRDSPAVTHVVDSKGVIHQYTMMSLSRETSANFDDIIFLCEGTNACIIVNGVPQGHWAKEHMHKFNLGNTKDKP